MSLRSTLYADGSPYSTVGFLERPGSNRAASITRHILACSVDRSSLVPIRPMSSSPFRSAARLPGRGSPRPRRGSSVAMRRRISWRSAAPTNGDVGRRLGRVPSISRCLPRSCRAGTGSALAARPPPSPMPRGGQTGWLGMRPPAGRPEERIRTPCSTHSTPSAPKSARGAPDREPIAESPRHRMTQCALNVKTYSAAGAIDFRVPRFLI